MKIQIFSPGPYCSLRRALLWWLLPVYVVVAIAATGASWWCYRSLVSGFMDGQMSLLAESYASNDGSISLQRLDERRVHRMGSYVVQVWNTRGELADTSLAGTGVPRQPTSGFQDVTIERQPWRVFTIAGEGQARTIQVMQSGTFRAHLVAERALDTLAPILLLLPLSLLALWAMVRTVSNALREVARQAAAQDEHSITELSLAGVPNEIVPLVTSFNSLLTRLRNAFDMRRQFVQDAAHELRTPIAAIGLQLENMRGDVRDEASAQRFAQLEAGVRRAQRLVDQLLKLTRQDSQTGSAPPDEVDVHAVLVESINTMIALADQRGIDLGLVGDKPAGATLRCRPSDLRSAIDSLLENALRYTPEGGVVDVRLSMAAGKPVIEISDSGPGIPPDMINRVFDRFFRVPGSPPGGSGLGLSIARAAARRCGLDVSLSNRGDGGSGLVARVAMA